MKVTVIAVLLCSLFLQGLSQDVVYCETKTLTPEESAKAISAKIDEGKTVVATRMSRGVPPDNGGNYGDLIYRHREERDRLLLREVVIGQTLTSSEQDVRWTVSIFGARISSVRVLNIGRERAYCIRIDVAAGDVQVILRVRPLYDPRVMIEIYGY